MLVAVLLLLVTSVASVAPGTRIVDLLSLQPPADMQTTLAVQACAGLLNRNMSGPAVFVLMHPEDERWLRITEPALPDPLPLTSIPALMSACFASSEVANRVIRYNYTQQQSLVPNIITLAAVLNAVPLEVGSPLNPTPAIVFDTTTAWAGFSELNATQFMYESYVNATTAMAKMNPGWDFQKSNVNPPLTLQPDLSLADFIVHHRIFNFYLKNGCIRGSPERALEEMIADTNPWPRPLSVYGYEDAHPVFGGDPFEAETTCVKGGGQIATTGVSGLSYLSRAPPVNTPLAQNPSPPFTYNASHVYLAIVVGDGDNVQYIKDQRFAWFQNRTSQCTTASNRHSDREAGSPCFPLMWSISPHLLTIAPDVIRWYYQTSRLTGRDYFTLPPSGWLYAYPALMGTEDQASFVSMTESCAHLMSASATVEWEFAGTWSLALSQYIPRYASRNLVRAFVTVNVPYLFPVEEFKEGEFFKIVNETLVVFSPFEWRGTSGAEDPKLHPYLLSASEMAAKIGAFPGGTATAMYVTSDGGANLQDINDLVSLLPEHVEVVTMDSLIEAALRSHAPTSSGE